MTLPILWRYVVKEHIGPFVFAMCVITLVFLLNLVFRELPRILSRGLEFSLIIEYFVLNMAWIIALAVPMAVLVASLMAFGRLSGDNEVVAMKAGGVSILYIITPVLICSVGLALFLIWFNNHVLPDFNHRARLLATDIGRKRPTLALEAGVLYRDLPNYTMLVQRIVEKPDTAYVDSVYIDDNTNPNSAKFITADHGKIYLNRHSGLLTIILYDGYMHELDMQKLEQYRRLRFPKQVLTISVPDMILERSNSDYRGDREKSAEAMRADIRDYRKELGTAESRYHRKAAALFNSYLMFPDTTTEVFQQAAARLIGPPLPVQRGRLLADHQRLLQEISGEMNFIESMERKIYKYSVEVHKKYSIPVACIIFVLVGAPLGIMSRRGSMAMATGISFSFFLLYWATLIGGEELADNRIITPFLSMWLANIVVGIGGLYLVYHSIHEATGLTNARAFKRLRWRRAAPPALPEVKT